MSASSDGPAQDTRESHNPDFDFEPVPGLPEHLPQGEQLLWQGSPDAKAMALRVMHLRSVGVAFAIMAMWWGASGWHDGVSSKVVATTVGATVLSGCVALAILALCGVLMARGTVYSVTSRRLVIRHGVAMPMSINIPFSKIDSAALADGRDGIGNVSFTPHARSRTSYVALWPHARPWHVVRPEPMLRCIPNAAEVAHLVAQAMAASVKLDAAPAPARRVEVALTELQPETVRNVRTGLNVTRHDSIGPAQSPVLT
jgi:Bacterial PH domain